MLQRSPWRTGDSNGDSPSPPRILLRRPSPPQIQHQFLVSTSFPPPHTTPGHPQRKFLPRSKRPQSYVGKEDGICSLRPSAEEGNWRRPEVVVSGADVAKRHRSAAPARRDPFKVSSDGQNKKVAPAADLGVLASERPPSVLRRAPIGGAPPVKDFTTLDGNPAASPNTCPRPCRSYVEVAKQGIQAASCSPAMGAPQDFKCRRSKVRFSPFPAVAFFQGDLPPCSVGRFGHPRRPSSSFHKPILKRDPEQGWRLCNEERRTQEGDSEQGWQLIRKPRWWRKERRGSSNSQPPANGPQRRLKFKEKLVGRCFNCLARDHIRAQCRNPVKCWICKRFGHISSTCNRRPHKGGQRPKHSTHCRPAACSLPHSSKPEPPQPAATTQACSSSEAGMERRLSIGAASTGSQSQARRVARPLGRSLKPRGSAVNYPGNPRSRPRVAFKIAETSEEMEQRRVMLTDHAVVITNEGPMAVQTCEEVKDIILHQFGIRKHECYVYRSYPHPFVAIFPDSHDRDIVFAAGRAVDGPIELGFHAWDLDTFGERENIPYHVRLSIEGIPQHAWSKEIADKVLCDEAIIHSIEEDTLERADQRAFRCWAYCKDPSKLPQVVYLTLTKFEQSSRSDAQIDCVRPRGMKQSHVFRVLVHIDAVEDLLFYHYPREELLADGKEPWKEFFWPEKRALRLLWQEKGSMPRDLSDVEKLQYKEENNICPLSDAIVITPQENIFGPQSAASVHWDKKVALQSGHCNIDQDIRPLADTQEEGNSMHKDLLAEKIQATGGGNYQSQTDVIMIIPQDHMQWEKHAIMQSATQSKTQTVKDLSQIDNRSWQASFDCISSGHAFAHYDNVKVDQQQTRKETQRPDVIVITPQEHVQGEMLSAMQSEQRQTLTSHHLADNQTPPQPQSSATVTKEASQAEKTKETANCSLVTHTTQSPHNTPHTQTLTEGVLQLSPITMDQSIQEQGQDLQELLRQFKQTTTTLLSGFILQTPQHKLAVTNETPPAQNREEARTWRSPRLKKKNSGGKAIVKLARELVAKKCGIMQDDESLDAMTLQQYLDLYKQPLSEQSLEAIHKLSEIAVEKKKKKKLKKDKKLKNQIEPQEQKSKINIDKKKKQKVAPLGAIV